MKKQIITAAAFAACLALRAAVWPQSEPSEETPAAPTQAAVTATQSEVPEIPEIEGIIIPEEEKAEIAQPKLIREAIIELEPTPVQTPLMSEVQATPEQSATPLQKSAPVLASSDSAPDNMVYVPGCGWIENQGPNHCEYAEDMYENGNRIGIMG